MKLNGSEANQMLTVAEDPLEGNNHYLTERRLQQKQMVSTSGKEGCGGALTTKRLQNGSARSFKESGKKPSAANDVCRPAHRAPGFHLLHRLFS